MKKYCLNMTVKSAEMLNDSYGLLRLSGQEVALPDGIAPGQFVQIEVPSSKTTFLRRPISVCFADYYTKELWLLIRNAGAGTDTLIHSKAGDVYSVILPLGHGFTVEGSPRVLLVGGGVGVAPLLYLGKVMHDAGLPVRFALGARSERDLLLLDEFRKYGEVYVSTEDGSCGQRGFITQNSVFDTPIDRICCCGPTPMMKAVARIARDKDIDCEVSLENMMACGLGACLCCVEDIHEHGNVCVCTEGPVFNIKQLKWEN